MLMLLGFAMLTLLMLPCVARAWQHLLLAPRQGHAESGIDAQRLVPLALANARRVRLNVDLEALLTGIRPRDHRVFA